MFGFKVIRQYEQGIVPRWGQAAGQDPPARVDLVNPVSDRLHKVNLQIVVSGVTSRDATVPGDLPQGTLNSCLYGPGQVPAP